MEGTIACKHPGKEPKRPRKRTNTKQPELHILVGSAACPFTYINHTLTPNTRFFQSQFTALLFIVTTQDIPPNTEITTSYGPDFFSPPSRNSLDFYLTHLPRSTNPSTNFSTGIG